MSLSDAFHHSSGGFKFPDAGTSAPSQHHDHGAGGFLKHLFTDVRDSAVGLPAGLVMTVRHPVRAIEDMGKTTWHDWSPLFHGDVKGFAHNVYDHPLGPILDVVSVATFGAGSVAKAAEVLTAGEYARALDAAAARGLPNQALHAQASLSRAAKLGREFHIPLHAPAGEGPTFSKTLSANPLTRQMEKAQFELGVSLGERLPSFLSKHGREGMAAHTEKLFGRWSMAGQYERALQRDASKRAAITGSLSRSVTAEIGDQIDAANTAAGRQITSYAEAGREIVNNPQRMYGVADGVMYLNALRTAQKVTEEQLGEKFLKGGRENVREIKLPLPEAHMDQRRAFVSTAAAHAPTKYTVPKGDKLYRVKRGKTVLAPPKGWTFMKDEAHRTPWTATTSEEVAQGMASWSERNTTANAAHAARDEHGNYLLVRDADMRKLGAEGKNTVKTLAELANKPTNAWKWAVLATRPAFFVNNTVGNTLMGMAAVGPIGFARGMTDAIRGTYSASSKTAESLDRKSARTLRHAIGDPNDIVDQLFMGPHRLGFGQEHMSMGPTWLSRTLKKKGAPRKVWKAAATAEKGFLPITHRVAETWIRRVLIHRYLQTSQEVRAFRSLGHSFDDAVRKAAEDPHFRMKMETKVDNALGQYYHFNSLERKIRAIVPFYSWDRAIMRHTIHLAKDRPMTAAVLQQVGESGTEETMKLLGAIPSFMKGYLPLELVGLGGGIGGRVATLSTQGVNPYATVPEVIDSIRALASGQVEAGPTLGSQISPFIGGAIEQTTHQSLLSGARVPEAPGGILGGALINTFESTPPAQVAKMLAEGPPKPKADKRTGKTKPFLAQKDMRHLLEGIVGAPVKNISPEATLRLADAESGRKKRKKAKAFAQSLSNANF